MAVAVVAASARPHTRPVVGQEEEAKAGVDDDDGDADDGAQN